MKELASFRVGSYANLAGSDFYGSQATAIARLKEMKMACEVQAMSKELIPCKSTNAHFGSHQVINLESDDGEVNNVFNDQFDNFQARQHSNGGTFHLNLDQKRSDPSIHGGISLSSVPMIQFEPIGLDPKLKCVRNIFGLSSSFMIEQEPPMKQRRFWSMDWHRRFLYAMKILGGPLATPKKIRDCMQVAYPREDEIRSHLLDYRLHLGCEACGPPLPPSQNTCARFNQDVLKMSENFIQSGSQQMPLQIGNSSNGQMVAAPNNPNDHWKYVSNARGNLPLPPSHNTCSVFTLDMLKKKGIFFQSGSRQMPVHMGETSNSRMTAAVNKANGGWKSVAEP